MYRWDIINHLIKLYDYQDYLEIGTKYGECFDKIICQNKIGVDPCIDNPLDEQDGKSCKADYVMTSDIFFSKNKSKYDIIFIDGLHESKQVIKDVENSLAVLNKNGTIVLHDCLPTTESMQAVPRTEQVWCGDTWRAVLYFRNSGYKIQIINTDYGVGILKDAKKEIQKIYNFVTFEQFSENKNSWFDILSPNEFLSRDKL